MTAPKSKREEPDLDRLQDTLRGGGEQDATAEQLAEEFGDTESADKAAMEAEKADPEDERNTP